MVSPPICQNGGPPLKNTVRLPPITNATIQIGMVGTAPRGMCASHAVRITSAATAPIAVQVGKNVSSTEIRKTAISLVPAHSS
ncbi:Uncharacterised protein [Mycobacteroides abscessus subsp. abscessus]|nr:Uncharacterised protein [Mycobacteroides abscessus subsp. abscessus]SHX27719.1 Uncharacterised protein [Mycobacteroides abscessus subsp. abscessus]SIL27552.1 Uncharacterised protein [Mycobacteroides abscessus subsp. abscessus]